MTHPACSHIDHRDPRSARACALFDRAYARWAAIDRRYHDGTKLLSDDRAFRIWMDAGSLVNRLFVIAMSDR